MTTTIGLDYTSAIHQNAGIGRYTRELLHALNQTRTPFHYQLFVADSRAEQLPLAPERGTWSPTRLSERWLQRLRYRLRLPIPVEIWTGRVDLFHAPDFILPSTLPGTRTITTIHDLSFERLPEFTMPGMQTFLERWVPDSIRRADHVIAVSQATKQDLIELYDTPADKISVLYHGVTSKFHHRRDPHKLAQIRATYNLPRPFIVAVSTIHPRKNYLRLLQAFAQLTHSVDLVIVGSKGWDYEPIFAEIERLQLTERVRFPGFVTDDDLPQLYQTAELLVYPSLYEGFGLPILEAMACGTPVVAANTSAIPEVVGSAGLMIDPMQVDDLAQAIQRVLDDSTLRAQLVAAGLDQALKFSWDGMAETLISVYEQLMET